MSVVSTLEFTATLPVATEFSPEPDNDWDFDTEDHDSVLTDDFEPATIPLKRPTASRSIEDVLTSATVLLMGAASICFVGYLAVNFYGSMIQYGPFEVIRALGGLH
ncbi:MAG: hypothetical protein KDA87_27295 [Planctomycetales bacterium]|nr:hypothetical protein [Planctomycetales bacterium]